MDVREKLPSKKRLIDANALGIGRCSKDILPPDYCAGWNGVINLIEKAPTVDAVEVVRCQDCTYWGDEDGKLHGSDGVLFARCKAHNYLIDGRHTGWCPSENDFCSYGERKDGDK